MRCKRWVVWGIGLLLCIMVGGICSPAAQAQKEAVSFRLEWSPDGYHGPYYAALKKGYFAEQGLDVTIYLGKGSGNTVQLVGAGENPIGNASYSVVAQAVDKDVPVKGVFGIYQKNPLGIITYKDLGVQAPKDLVGKSVTMSPYGDSLVLLPVFLKANKIDPQAVKAVTIASLAAREASFLERKVDGIVEWGFTKIPALEAAKKADYNFLRFADWRADLLSNGIIVNTNYLKAKPDVVRRFLVAIKKGFQFAMARPEETIDIMMQQFPEIKDKALLVRVLKGSFDLLETENTKGKPMGWMSEKDWARTLEILKEANQLKRELPISAYYTAEFIPK